MSLAKGLAAELSETQMYRIDHYLGKEIAQAMMSLRFANSVFEPLWNRKHVEAVHICFKEDIGTMGRGGYFDEYGIIRDVMQNHLLQLLALVAMEPPISQAAEDVRNRKVDVLRSISPVRIEDVVVGQYGPGKGEPGYLEDKTVPEGSVTPTYAMLAMYINNPRWDGVPFILSAGKAMDEKKVDIRIQFKEVAGNIYSGQHIKRNELVMRVQPDEAIYLRVMTKNPGLKNNIVDTDLLLSYKQRFEGGGHLPDAYERLIYDALKGDSSLFVRDDELAAAWRIFTPVLQMLEGHEIQPDQYPFGTVPIKAQELLEKLGYIEEGS